MADKKNKSSEDMSVDELVDLLRNNISSAGEPEEDSSERKTISKKTDSDKDIASMLKKFMPDENQPTDDFELDEVSDEENADNDFELESDSELVYDESGDEAEEFEIDDSSAAYGDDFDEPEDKMIEDFEPDDEDIVDAVAFDTDDVTDIADAEKAKGKSKGLGGLFGLGRKKSGGLADGYAKMLEMELDSENGDISDVEEQIDVFDEEAMGYGEKNDEQDFAELMDETDMPELEVDKSQLLEDETPEDTSASGDASSEPVPGPMFVLDNKVGETADGPEEDYFVSEKKPLAFDDEDETPIVPDAAAFENVPSSDAKPDNIFDEDDPDEVDAAEGLDDKDINLMIALGYEEELEKAIGKKNVDDFSDQLNAEIVDFIDVDKSYAFDGFELNSPERFRSVGNKYKQENSIMKMRLLGTGFFALALFIFEFLGMFGVTLGGALNIHHYPVVGIMLSLQLLILAAALSWRQILDGLRDAVTFCPSPSSISAVAVLMTVIYDVIMALIAPNTGLSLYNFPAALCLVFMVLGDYFDLSREIRAFNTIATRRPKYAVTPSSAADRSTEEEMMEIFADENHDYTEAKKFDVRKVGFIDNYFRRTNIRSLKSRKLCLVIFPFIALAVALGILSYVTNKSGLTAFNVSILTVLFGMPMSLMFVYSYPFFSAVKTIFGEDATIIGEESIEEYSDATTISFAEKDVFPIEATITKGIKLYDNNAIYYVLYHLTSLYSKIGGPLKDRLVQATAEMGHSENVEIIKVAEKGIEATVDGKVNVIAGQASYIEEKGIFVGSDKDDEAMLAEGTSTLYLVLDGVLSAKLYVSYGIDPEFENVISVLGSENMEVVIRTCDPNIDDELLASKLRISRFPARIVKCYPDDNADVPAAESGIVARSSLTSLSHAISLCNKIRRVRKTGRTVSIISMVVSVAMMIFLSLFSSQISIPSVYVALYQVFWMIPMLIFTKLYVK